MDTLSTDTPTLLDLLWLENREKSRARMMATREGQWVDTSGAVQWDQQSPGDPEIQVNNLQRNPF